MMPLPSIEHGAQNGEDEEELMPGQKPKTLPCRYCQKRFRRLEHVQRHERTHTKEKPFRCGCGKTFGRRDLLVRHEKLVHLSESSRAREERNANLMASQTQAQQQQQQQHYPPPPASVAAQMSPPSLLSVPSLIDPDLLMTNHQAPMYSRTPGCSLDLLSDAANHLAQESDLLQAQANAYGQPHLPQMATPETRHHDVYRPDMSGMGNGSMHPEHHEQTPSRGQDFGPGGAVEDYNLFLDDVGGMSNYFLPSSAFDSDLPVSNWAKPESTSANSIAHLDPALRGERGGREKSTDGQENNSFSRFGSRLPSLQPEFENGERPDGAMRTSNGREGPPWKISSEDLREIARKLDDFRDILPKGFALPSRHTLSRFLEGYINGFHEHLPFLHLPTITAVNIAPELLLALAAVGAQYRFESHRGNGLWYAAKAVAQEQVRRRNNHQVVEILTPGTPYGTDSMAMSPQSSTRNIDNQTQQDYRGFSVTESEAAQTDPRLGSSLARLETIQALLLLMAMGTWAPRALLREALSIQSQLALLVREAGLIEGEPPMHDLSLSWEDWIRIEGAKRTKFIVYCFFNLHCIAYDMPPLLLTSELHLNLPQSAREWKAESSSAWVTLRRQTQPAHISFHETLARLFSKTPSEAAQPPMSSLGNYILIHAIIQQIFFARQTSSVSHPQTQHNGLLNPAIDELGSALKQWQSNWELTPESSLDPSNPYGPVAFNSTALLRLAYIRLHSDLGPCRKLESRDPIRIAREMGSCRLLERGPRLSRAVLQSAHALSIPVKIGVRWVARTQTFSWSIQHSLCNLECAFLLSKWLETIAQSPMDLSADERNLLEMVRSMLDETEFAVNFEPPSPAPALAALSTSTSAMEDEEKEWERSRIKQLGAAVVRLWAETFKGTHIFAIVKVIGTSLEVYADLLERGEAGGGGG